MADERVILFYDRDCGFCRVMIAAFLAWDRRGVLRPARIQSSEGDLALADIQLERRLASWHLVEPGDRVHSAGAVFPPLLRRLPGGRPLAALAEAAAAPVDAVYRWVASRRRWWGRLLPAGAKAWATDRIAERAGTPAR